MALDVRALCLAPQWSMPCYDGVYVEYLGSFVQFGHITLFAAVFPLGALFAIVNSTLLHAHDRKVAARCVVIDGFIEAAAEEKLEAVRAQYGELMDRR